MTQPLLSVKDLVIEFSTQRGIVRAIDGVSFDIMPGETLGLVGESGCGKSVTSLAILGLIPSPPGRIISGSIRLDGRELVGLPESEYRHIRGKEISMIFQEPMTALNPVFTIATQMTDVIMRHQGMTRKQARERAIEMLSLVGIPSPGKRIDEYPHQMSGGMRQRVMIAMALSCNPKLLLADEPTTALDVTTQAQVLEQMVKLQDEFDTSVVLVTHDLGVVAQTCSRAVVMYAGRVAEQAPIHPLFNHPQHPYTEGLLKSIPRIREQKLDELPTIPGTVPDLLHLPSGCRFVDRCYRADDACHQREPDLQWHNDQAVACFHPVGEAS
ncbi:ABC transporter ATP-binding protein [Thiolapillus brandeum]|uniref:ABC-type dipeptide transporter n=1 Tax=Thiolapillus brandeum TaxID=1076588 RepID=A0A7U6GHW1_9GAMM|nr:ABC transporter ATP-binding protein [Thiolapillus brandeum]BAO43919.1 peptide/nickel transporter ATP-binding protein [Thiolapillus brandeum]